MAIVYLICLANSYKMGGRCLAGLRADGQGWVRPVAPDALHGQLYWRHFKLSDGTEPGPLDVVGVDLAEACPSPGQPENWTIGNQPWILRRRPAGRDLYGILRSALVPGPALLGSFGRSIAERASASACSSLALVAPAMLRWSVGERVRNRRQPRVLFKLKERLYNLPVTDPLWTAKITRSLMGKGPGWQPSGAVGIPRGQVLITVSLGEPYEGQRYKLAAGIVVLPS